MNVLVTQSLFKGNEYYIFRPLGNDQYRELKFTIIKSRIIVDNYEELHAIESHYINTHILKAQKKFT